MIKFDGYYLNYLYSTMPLKTRDKYKNILKNGDKYRNLIKFFENENKNIKNKDSLNYDIVINAIKKKQKVLNEDKKYKEELKKAGYVLYKGRFYEKEK